jgi:long-chain acyl-CoA synthetase
VTDADARPWLRFYPPWVAPEIVQRFPTALELWEAAVAARGPTPCLRFFDATLTYAEVDRAAQSVADGLRTVGVRPGDRVGILLQNDPEWAIALLAAWRAGAVAVSLSPLLRERELAAELADAGVSVLVALDSLYDSGAREAAEQAGVSTVLVTHPAEWVAPEQWTAEAEGLCGVPATGSAARLAGLAATARRARPSPEPRPSPEDVAVLMYTSGTTGPAKAAMLTFGALAYNAQVYGDWFRLGASDPVLGIAPLFHVTGLVGHLLLSWYAGSPLVLSHRFDTGAMMRSIARWRPTFSLAALTAYLALLEDPEMDRHDLSSLRHVASGGAPVSTAVVDRFARRTGLTITSVYGLTETTSPSHLTPPGRLSPLDPQSGTLAVGVPVPGALARVVDAETGRPLPPGELGEIVVSGPMVVPGYWGKPEETSAAIRDGWLFTGDIGRMTDDGWFFVVDRKKDQINASGYKVWPREVEEVLHEHEDVVEAAVTGVPDPYRGESVVAFVVRRAGSSLDAGGLIAFCRARLASFKCPKDVVFVPTLPKTTSGKLLRRELRDAYRAAGRTVPGRLAGAPTEGMAASPHVTGP